MSFTRHLINHGHVNRLVVTRDLQGWEVREEETPLSCVGTPRDWHPDGQSTFDIKARALKRGGVA